MTIEFLTAFLNYLISAKRVSAVLKEGTLTPIYKKGDTGDPGNYRGITVTPVLLKILEHILLDITKSSQVPVISPKRIYRRMFLSECRSHSYRVYPGISK